VAATLLRVRPAVLAGIATFALALAPLALLRSGSALHPPFPKDQAVRAALRDKDVGRYLDGNPWTRARVIALDQRNWRVTFTDGPRYILDLAIGPSGTVDAAQAHPPSGHPAGSKTLWTPALLVVLAALFAFAVATVPLRSTRNLDALVIAGGFTLAMLLFDARLVGLQTLVGDATLAYVAYRCARVGFGAREPSGEPAYRHLVPPAHRERSVLLLGLALLVAGVVVTVTSTLPSDVAAANLAGATLLNHGTIPYGHLPPVAVHGDTYPLLSYVLYMPFAAFGPVRDAFDSLDGALWLNAVALTIGALLLAWRGGPVQLLAWLAFPAVFAAASTGGNDVPAALLVIVALAVFARPLAAVAIVALAGWVKVVPAVAAVPFVARLRNASALRAVGVVVAIFAAGVLAIVAVGGTGAVADAWDAMRFQFVRGSWFSFWQQTGTRWLQPAFQAATLGFAAAIAVTATRSTIDLRRAAGFAGALIALLQLGANYWTYSYLPWLLPFILVALFPSEPRRSQQRAPLAP
jgi:hypothetical protein